jgi:hypothetical protein
MLLKTRRPSTRDISSALDPAAIGVLSPETKQLYLRAFTDALQPIFFTAAVIAAIAFVDTAPEGNTAALIASRRRCRISACDAA